LTVREVLLQRLDQRGWQGREPVLPALAMSHRDLASREVDVLDGEVETLQEPQAGPVQQAGDDAGYAVAAGGAAPRRV
jgi:hypothetical protein